ncbi:MAG TPA: uracil permease [Clostridiales bacterium]|jgi:uracil permease|nr:uracil permease [Clostridiales bacterium]
MEMVTQETKISTSKLLLLGIQHVLAMFGATVLVPALTGLNPAVALFTAGVGTIIFHLVTGRKVPVFLGSSFAFIPVILLVGETYGLPYATGGIVIAGSLYLVLAGLVMVFGVERVKSFFPPIVTGPMIMVIGLTLAPTIVTNNIVAETLPGTLAQRWIIALSVLAVMIIVSVFAKGFFKLVPILFGIATGYILSLIFGGGIVNLEPVAKAKWLAFPDFMAPRFGIEAITLIAPVALVTFMEHIGDITTNGAVIGKNLMKDPGLHRTLLGDGLATMFAGLVGGPANTTYSENTGVLAVTKIYNPVVIQIAAIIAILMSLIGKFGALLQTIPAPVMGGVSLLLFGMIASIGLRTISDAQLDFTNSRNLIVVSIILVMGLSGVVFNITSQASLSGLSLAAVVGVVLNKVLPENI